MRCGSGANAANAAAIDASSSPAARSSATAAQPFARRMSLSKYEPASSAHADASAAQSHPFTGRRVIPRSFSLSAW